MEKLKFSLSQKAIIFSFLSLFIFHQNSFSQCVIADPVQEFCASDYKTVADIEVTSGINVVWFDALTGGTQYDSSADLINGTSYYALDIDASCTDPTRVEVTVLIYGEPPTNVDVFVGKCASEKSTINDLSADGIDIKWFSDQTAGTELPTSTELLDGQTYWVQQTENGCTSERLPTTVNLIDPATPTLQSVQTFCSTQNATVGDLKANESNVVWYSTEDSSSPLSSLTPLINGEDYWASQIVFPCESTVRIQTTVVIDTVSNAGTDGSYSECELDVTTTNLFSLLGGTPDTAGVWSGPSSLSGGYLGTFEPGVNTEGTYTYTVASNLGVCPDQTANVVVTITKVTPPSGPTNQTFCEIDNPTVGSLNPSSATIKWYDSDSSSTPLDASATLIDGKVYYATETNPAGCESANKLEVTVTIDKPLPPTGATTQLFCEIDNPTVGSLSPNGSTINWYDSNSSITPLDPSTTLVDGQIYYATQTSALGCESLGKLEVSVTVDAPLAPAGPVTQLFCEIDNPTVGSLSPNGTGINWYNSDTSTTPLATTDALVNGNVYYATLTSIDGCESIKKLEVTVTIDTPLAPTGPTSQTFCEIDNPTVGSLNPSGTGINWYDSNSSTTPLDPSVALVNGQIYYATETSASGCESVKRLMVTATIDTPLAPTGSATQLFCEIDNPTVGSLSPNGANINWYDSASSTSPLDPSTALVDGQIYYATQISDLSCESIDKLEVTVTVDAPLAPAGSATQTFCEIENATVSDLSPSGATINWYESPLATTPLDTTLPLVDGQIYYATEISPSGCESVDKLEVTVSIDVPIAPIGSANQTFCEIENATVSDLSPNGTGINWYDSNTSTTALATTDALIDGNIYYATQTNVSGCESVLRLEVTVAIDAPLTPTGDTNQTFCMNDFAPNSPTISDLIVSGTDIHWYATETSTTLLNTTDILVDGQTYWASQTNTSGCESILRLEISVVVSNPPNATTTNSSQTFCAANNPTIADIDVTGDTIIWFDTEISTTPLSTTDALIDGEDYWALNTDGTTGCESSDRLQIISTVVDVPAPIIDETTQSFCEASNPTIVDLAAPSGTIWFASETSTIPLNTTDLLANNNIYWASAVNSSGCNSSVKVGVTVVLNNPGTPILANFGNEFCKINNPTLDDLNARVSPANNGSITWYDAFPNGTELSLSEFLIDRETYYAIETDSNGCISVTPLDVTVDLEACDEYDIVIYDGFSPNGDGINDTFKFENLRTLYPDFKVEFFNRWGNLVFTSDANRGDWNGRLKGDGEYVTSGVYYFVINFNKDNRKPLQDRLYLSR